MPTILSVSAFVVQYDIHDNVEIVRAFRARAVFPTWTLLV